MGYSSWVHKRIRQNLATEGQQILEICGHGEANSRVIPVEVMVKAPGYGEPEDAPGLDRGISLVGFLYEVTARLSSEG